MNIQLINLQKCMQYKTTKSSLLYFIMLWMNARMFYNSILRLILKNVNSFLNSYIEITRLLLPVLYDEFSMKTSSLMFINSNYKENLI